MEFLSRVGVRVSTTLLSVAFLRWAMIAAVPVAVLLYSVAGIVGDIPATNYQRFFYHALPVAISVLHRGWPYDHTADMTAVNSLVWSQPLEQSLNSTIYNAATLSANVPDSQGTYFWMVDDRGLADFTILAFKLFGERMVALSVLWFAFLLLTIVLFIASARRSRGTLLLGTTWVWSLAISAPLFLLPQDSTGTTQAFQPILHLTESRFFTLLAVLPVVAIASVVLRSGWSKMTSILMVPQVVFLMFLCSIRGTVRIYIAALIVLAVATALVQLFRRKNGQAWRSGAVAVGLAGAVALLPVVQGSIENPKYAEMGSRTVWHNALMGFGYSPELSVRYGLLAADHSPLALVLAYRDTGDIDAAAEAVRQDPEGYFARAQEALNWTTTASDFDWIAYEANARTVFLQIVSRNPTAALTTLVVDKPRAVQSLAGPKLVRLDLSQGLGGRYVLLFLAAFALGLASRRPIAYRSTGRVLLGILGLAAVSLLPSLAFYTGSTQIGELLVLIGAAGAAVGVAAGQRARLFVSRAQQHRGSTPVSQPQ